MWVALNASGAKTTPSVGPAGTLYVDGVANAATVTITGSNPYYWSVTLPTLTSSGVVSLYITATVGGVSTAEVVEEETTYAGSASTSGTNILTAAEAATVLRCDVSDQNMLDLLPLVDHYIEMATGRDWAADAAIYPEAKTAARILLVRWHEDPGAMAAGEALGPGWLAAIAQLEAKALLLESDGVPYEALALVGSMPASGAVAAVTIHPVLIFNHEMAAAATGFVTIEKNGAAIACTNTLDGTGKIMTLTPGASLSAASSYTIVIDYAPDVYGGTIYKEVGFTTA
jgi:hypothetical protein